MNLNWVLSTFIPKNPVESLSCTNKRQPTCSKTEIKIICVSKLKIYFKYESQEIENQSLLFPFSPPSSAESECRLLMVIWLYWELVLFWSLRQMLY